MQHALVRLHIRDQENLQRGVVLEGLYEQGPTVRPSGAVVRYVEVLEGGVPSEGFGKVLAVLAAEADPFFDVGLRLEVAGIHLPHLEPCERRVHPEGLCDEAAAWAERDHVLAHVEASQSAIVLEAFCDGFYPKIGEEVLIQHQLGERAVRLERGAQMCGKVVLDVASGQLQGRQRCVVEQKLRQSVLSFLGRHRIGAPIQSQIPERGAALRGAEQCSESGPLELVR
mmetsp:Transcript_44648/g.108956  ORF Transcript_44648/g.108956 Transcript_44648/m.108956 type:complete len:227 (-) Transcript_44648:262-942(-)